MPDEKEHGAKWWIRYVLVPLAVAIIGGGGICSILVVAIPYIFPTPQASTNAPTTQVNPVTQIIRITELAKVTEIIPAPPTEIAQPTQPIYTLQPTITPLLTNTPIAVESSLCPDYIPRSQVQQWSVGEVSIDKVQPYLDDYERYRLTHIRLIGKAIPAGVVLATDFGNGQSYIWKTLPVKPIVHYHSWGLFETVAELQLPSSSDGSCITITP